MSGTEHNMIVECRGRVQEKVVIREYARMMYAPRQACQSRLGTR